MKYMVTFRVTTTYEIEIEADSAHDARNEFLSKEDLTCDSRIESEGPIQIMHIGEKVE